MTRRFLLLASLCVIATTAVAQPTPSAARPIRALYITGGGFHDFTAQKEIVPSGISARTNIVWTIDHTADTCRQLYRFP